MDNHGCEYREAYLYGEGNCICQTCLVKMICTRTCELMELEMRGVLYDYYKQNYGDSEALKGHVEAKCKRLMILRSVVNTAIKYNPCANYK